MTPTTRTELMNIAKDAAAYTVGNTFQIDSETLSAVIVYEAETDEDRGDYWTGPIGWTGQETVSVEGVYNEDGDNDTEAAEWLAKRLN